MYTQLITNRMTTCVNKIDISSSHSQYFMRLVTMKLVQTTIIFSHVTVLWRSHNSPDYVHAILS